MKIMVVFGTRPEVIKLAPVVAEAQRRSDTVQLTICSTGQHREMLHQALGVFGIQPDIDLAVMHANQTLSGLTARLMESLGAEMRQSAPDVVLVQGDTTTAFVAALSAFYLHIPVGHVEAGLRTGDLASPFPEELNRVLIARMARWHFAPTAAAVSSLRVEGVDASRIHLTGNTVVDAIAAIQQRWVQPDSSDAVRLAGTFFPGRELVLVTAHRRENQGPAMHQVCLAIRTLCEQHPELGFVFPVHLSPTVRTVVHKELSGNICNLLLIDPVDFETNLYLQSRSRLIITDSGGIQEEAPSFAVPTVVMRENTERMEGVATGFATLAGTNTETIIRTANTWLADTNAKERLSSKANPYGDGQAAKRILDVLQGLPVGAFTS
jgi:UDP-N-acetylglucosamine 2-epimerase (non-hydrolysing)